MVGKGGFGKVTNSIKFYLTKYNIGMEGWAKKFKTYYALKELSKIKII